MPTRAPRVARVQRKAPIARATTETSILSRIASFFKGNDGDAPQKNNETSSSSPPPAAAAAPRPPPVFPETVLTWSQLEAAVSKDVLGDYQLREGAVPSSYRRSSVISQTDATEPPPPTAAAVMLFSDTNSWCPFAQRVSFYLKLREENLPHDVALIDLRDKPPYYGKLVPTSKVPAVFIKSLDAPAEERGELVYESLDIIARLEKEYPNGALDPREPENAGAAKATAEALRLVDSVAAAGFGLVRAVAPPPPAGSPYASMPAPPPAEEARATLVSELEKLEEILGYSEGPFIGGTKPSTADVAFAPQLERVAATLPASTAKFVIRGADDAGKVPFPRITAWFDALEKIPAYLETRGDAGTHRVVSKRLLGSSLAEPKYKPQDERAAKGCAAKLIKNAEAIKRDIIKNAGVASLGLTDSSSSSLADDVDNALRRVVTTLIEGHPGPAAQAPSTFASPPEPAAAAKAAATNAIAAAVAAFLASRVSAPRDMSGSEAIELRAACLRVAQGAYTGL